MIVMRVPIISTTPGVFRVGLYFPPAVIAEKFNSVFNNSAKVGLTGLTFSALTSDGF